MNRSQERSELCLSHEEEMANAASHAAGVLLGLGALGLMLPMAAQLSPWHVAGVSVFGASLVLLYLASTLYHWVTAPEWKRLFQVLDHALIFVLIAGSYTPWLLVNLRGPLGWSLFAGIWGAALAGMVLKAFFLPRFDKLGTVLYLAMGWAICVALKPMVEAVNAHGLAWLAAGGVCYTAGVAFYLMKRKFAHFTWHLFVLAGSACHVVAVFVGVLA